MTGQQNKNLDDITDKCYQDEKDGYRCVDDKGKSYCSLLDPNYNKSTICPYKGSIFLKKLPAGIGTYDKAFYYCGKPKPDGKK